MTLGEFIEQDYGGVISAFASAVKVTRSTAYRWVNNERKPRPRQIERIVKLSGGRVTIKDFA